MTVTRRAGKEGQQRLYEMAKLPPPHPHTDVNAPRRAGLEEQRLYEMAKLRAQFQELLQDVGLMRIVGG